MRAIFKQGINYQNAGGDVRRGSEVNSSAAIPRCQYVFQRTCHRWTVHLCCVRSPALKANLHAIIYRQASDTTFSITPMSQLIL